MISGISAVLNNLISVVFLRQNKVSTATGTGIRCSRRILSVNVLKIKLNRRNSATTIIESNLRLILIGNFGRKDKLSKEGHSSSIVMVCAIIISIHSLRPVIIVLRKSLAVQAGIHGYPVGVCRCIII